MDFKEAIQAGIEPRCIDCIYFDNRILRVVGSNLLLQPGVNDKPSLVEKEDVATSGCCRHDPPGPAGWVTIMDGTQTWCGAWVFTK